MEKRVEEVKDLLTEYNNALLYSIKFDCGQILETDSKKRKRIYFDKDK